jgi:hypothetical protein
LNQDSVVHEKPARRCGLLFRRWSQKNKAESALTPPHERNTTI